MKRKLDKDKSREDFAREGRIGEWVFYLDHWWKIIQKHDWLLHDVEPALILRRNSKNRVWYLGV